MLVVFFMISVAFTGCVEDEEDEEDKRSDFENAVNDYVASIRSEDRKEYCKYWEYTVDEETNTIILANNTVLDECAGNKSNYEWHNDSYEYKITVIYFDEMKLDYQPANNSGYVHFAGVAVEDCRRIDESEPWDCDTPSFDIEMVKVDGQWLHWNISDEEDNPPGEGSGCIDYDDENGNGLYDVGEPCHDDHSAISYKVTVNSLEDVFNNMTYDGEYYYTKEEWVIHDISEIVEIDGMLMFGVTGKAQEDGYNCGLETWYIFPGESEFTPGQCLLSEKPAWHSEHVPSNDGALWAPNFHGSRTMYYTVPTSEIDGQEDTKSCIGMVTATGTAPNLVWTDHGEPIICQLEGEENDEDPEPPALDPAIFIDDGGRMYMVYGGAHIWITELDSETGEHISGDPLSWDNGDNGDYVHLANGPSDAENDGDPWIEAPYIHKEGDWYYLFVNWYDCCQGVDSTYEIFVGRSESVTGPYLDETGTDMLEDGGTLVIAHESHDVIGPGHAGIFEYGTGEDKVQVFTHHYYPDDETPWAYAHARVLTWENGWPVVSQELWNPMDYWATNK